MSRRNGNPAAATFRAGALMALPSILRDLGYAPESILRSAGLEPGPFDDPDIRIPFVAGGKLLAACVAATGCEHIGLLAGSHVGPSTLGLAGFILRNAPDVGAALGDLVRHLDLHDQGAVVTLDTSSRTSRLGYVIIEPSIEAADQIYDVSIAAGCNIMRSLCGRDWNPSEVLLSRRRPRDPAPWVRHFRAPIRFDAGQSAIDFPSHWLEHRLPSADSMLHQHLVAEADALHLRNDDGPVGDVRRLVHSSMARGGNARQTA